jgi:hypothetical protein
MSPMRRWDGCPQQLSILAHQQPEQSSLTQHARERLALTAWKKTREATIFLDAVGVRRWSIDAELCASPSRRVRLPLREDIRARHEIEADPAG